MAKEDIEDILSRVSPTFKRELLDRLLSCLFDDLNDAEKKEPLGAVLASRQSSGQVVDMVEHWIQTCEDSGVNPVEMSKEMISATNHSHELVTYSPPQLQCLFNEWLGEIEGEVLDFLADRDNSDSDEMARRFKLERESVIFIMSKLAREGKINIKASGNSETMGVRLNP
jgi:hypothetical protein